MDEKPDEIMNHIESQRDQLGRNLNELETRVKRTTDWRAQVDRNPMLAMGVALGGGLLIGSMVGRGRRSDRSTMVVFLSGQELLVGESGFVDVRRPPVLVERAASSGKRHRTYREQRRKTSDTLENIKAALIAFGTAKVKEFMSEALPGFHQHLDEAERHGAIQAAPNLTATAAPVIRDLQGNIRPSTSPAKAPEGIAVSRRDAGRNSPPGVRIRSNQADRTPV